MNYIFQRLLVNAIPERNCRHARNVHEIIPRFVVRANGTNISIGRNLRQRRCFFPLHNGRYGYRDRQRKRNDRTQYPHRILHNRNRAFAATVRLTESNGQNIFIQQRYQNIHNQNRQGNTLGSGSEPTNNDRKNTQTDRIQNTVIFPFRRGCVIGCHKHGAEHQTARKQLQ